MLSRLAGVVVMGRSAHRAIAGSVGGFPRRADILCVGGRAFWPWGQGAVAS
jgi:hypothetical protein